MQVFVWTACYPIKMVHLFDKNWNYSYANLCLLITDPYIPQENNSVLVELQKSAKLIHLEKMRH
jgi:hypothetical protein